MQKGEIWIVDLSDGKGHEQKGSRPALVMGRANKLTVVLPLTSQMDRAQFPFTELIERTPTNGLGADSLALIFQIMALDDQRFKQCLGTISKEKQVIVDKLLVDLLKLG